MATYTEDENGYVTIPNNPISKSGVFQYLGRSISPNLEPDKVYNVWRPESELNNPETIESFKLTPWIPEHVMLGNNFTSAESVGVRGVTGEDVKYVGDTLYSNLKLFASDLKAMIRDGLKELSCGFRCSWEIVSGFTPDGQSYDVIQRNIRGNHLASVEQARMGSDVRVAMDRAVFALDHLDFELQPDGETMELKELVVAVQGLTKTVTTMQTAMDGVSQDMKDMKEKTSDMEEKNKKKAEDEEKESKEKEEESKKTSEAMDSMIKTVNGLAEKFEKIQSTAMDGNALMKSFAEKTQLANDLSRYVGAFDHSEMDREGVAKYGVEKLGIACDSGHEVTAVKVWLGAQRPAQLIRDPGVALDGSDLTSDKLDELGI